MSYKEVLSPIEISDATKYDSPRLVETAAETSYPFIYEQREPELIIPGRPNLIVITGASGSGKDTIIEPLIEKGDLIHVRTGTSRQARVGESDDSYVWFRPRSVTETSEDYIQNLTREYGLVEANYKNDAVYGLPKSSVDNISPENIGVLRTGIYSIPKIRTLLGETTNILVFTVIPESLDTLWDRINGRGNEVERMRNGLRTHKLSAEYIDYYLWNRTIDDEMGFNGADLARISLMNLVNFRLK